MLGTHHFVLIYFKLVRMILAQRVVYLTCILRAIGVFQAGVEFFFNPNLGIAFESRKQHSGAPFNPFLKMFKSASFYLSVVVWG